MTPHTIPLSHVKVSDRMRKDLGDLTGLKDSIAERGLIQPIVLDRNFNLVAGERRYRCHELLGLADVKYVFTEEIDEDTRAELEFDENFWRKSFTWQEECLGILNIFRKKRTKGALEGWAWGQRQCAEMFGMSLGNINYVLAVAKKLEEEIGPDGKPLSNARYHAFQSVNEAYRLGLMQDDIDKANAELVRRAKALVNTPRQEAVIRQVVEEVRRVEATPDLLAKERERYASNPLNVVPFDEYWAEKTAIKDEMENTVFLSNKIHHVDSIDFMLRPENRGRFNHIITDPPYAIDMDNLNQNNMHGGLRDLNRVIDAHQVEENTSLLSRFFPAAFQCTDDRAFVIACGDPMLWQHMYDAAIGAGFAVQRWPIIWRKVNQSVMNQCAGYNTTKDYEIAIVCRKPGAVLAAKRNSSIIEASNSEAVKLTGHPFAKPFELTKEFLNLVSTEGQLILDPFAGGGSLVLEFLRHQRNFECCEKEEHHFNSLVENIKQQHFLRINPKFVFK